MSDSNEISNKSQVIKMKKRGELDASGDIVKQGGGVAGGIFGPRMVMKNIEYVPGLYKIYDEVLVNAIDHWTRMGELVRKQKLIRAGQMDETPEVTLKMKFRPVTTLSVEIDQDSGTISIMNDGDGLPVAIHEEYKVYVPEMLFSQFLTSGNYKSDKINQIKVIGGKNGKNVDR